MENKESTSKRPTREELDAKWAPVKAKLERFQNMKRDENKEKEKDLDKEEEKII